MFRGLRVLQELKNRGSILDFNLRLQSIYHTLRLCYHCQPSNVCRAWKIDKKFPLCGHLIQPLELHHTLLQLKSQQKKERLPLIALELFSALQDPQKSIKKMCKLCFVAFKHILLLELKEKVLQSLQYMRYKPSILSYVYILGCHPPENHFSTDFVILKFFEISQASWGLFISHFFVVDLQKPHGWRYLLFVIDDHSISEHFYRDDSSLSPIYP